MYFDPNQTGSIVHDKGTPAADVSETGVLNIVLKNVDGGDPDNKFGVLLNGTFADLTAAWAAFAYTYTIELDGPDENGDQSVVFNAWKPFFDGHSTAHGRELHPVHQGGAYPYVEKPSE
jgi:hypothetical protein